LEDREPPEGEEHGRLEPCGRGAGREDEGGEDAVEVAAEDDDRGLVLGRALAELGDLALEAFAKRGDLARDLDGDEVGDAGRERFRLGDRGHGSTLSGLDRTNATRASRGLQMRPSRSDSEPTSRRRPSRILGSLASARTDAAASKACSFE